MTDPQWQIPNDRSHSDTSKTFELGWGLAGHSLRSPWGAQMNAEADTENLTENFTQKLCLNFVFYKN